jgi:hypothetical protein
LVLTTKTLKQYFVIFLQIFFERHKQLIEYVRASQPLGLPRPKFGAI